MVTNTNFVISRRNAQRFVHALFPPDPDALRQVCQQGFDDALDFLQKNGLVSCPRCSEILTLASQSSFRGSNDIQSEGKGVENEVNVLGNGVEKWSNGVDNERDCVGKYPNHSQYEGKDIQYEGNGNQYKGNALKEDRNCPHDVKKTSEIVETWSQNLGLFSVNRIGKKVIFEVGNESESSGQEVSDEEPGNCGFTVEISGYRMDLNREIVDRSPFRSSNQGGNKNETDLVIQTRKLDTIREKRSYGSHGDHGTHETQEAQGSYGTQEAHETHGAQEAHETHGIHEAHGSNGTQEAHGTHGADGARGTHNTHGTHGLHLNNKVDMWATSSTVGGASGHYCEDLRVAHALRRTPSLLGVTLSQSVCRMKCYNCAACRRKLQEALLSQHMDAAMSVAPSVLELPLHLLTLPLLPFTRSLGLPFMLLKRMLQLLPLCTLVRLYRYTTGAAVVVASALAGQRKSMEIMEPMESMEEMESMEQMESMGNNGPGHNFCSPKPQEMLADAEKKFCRGRRNRTRELVKRRVNFGHPVGFEAEELQNLGIVKYRQELCGILPMDSVRLQDLIEESPLTRYFAEGHMTECWLLDRLASIYPEA
ncbi:uncharacterized protein LOC108671161 [Hyalella azteca]|uniref:Uncharacterized protein LOC108671161 n=1 Tax=Hyalella azteca TaxID=294128 RepID=A0A979FWV8_HYAAZ|nr:uncharacterized protein LOC108671161 [Hyalella azteca]